jgi:hypothetical protein
MSDVLIFMPEAEGVIRTYLRGFDICGNLFAEKICPQIG